MARPLRIQFPGAWYHVMNRGAGRRVVFPGDAYRRCFLDLLGHIHERYAVEVHGWCLMDNHYHLVLRTPLANLGRAMRHVDGVYTQRHNKLSDTDGALFRGRYQAIVIGDDPYLAQVSRYVHRNPVEAHLVDCPQAWPWSSYHAFIARGPSLPWLHTAKILAMFGSDRTARRRYRAFVEEGLDDATRRFYDSERKPTVLGPPQFRAALERAFANDDATEIPGRRQLQTRPDLDSIIAATAAAFDVEVGSLLNGRQGRSNVPRAVAMQLCRSPGGYPLKVIASAFGLRSYTGVAMAAQRLRQRLDDPALRLRVDALRRRLFGPV